MNDSSHDNDLKAALARLDSLEREIDSQISQAQRNGRLMIIVGIVVVVFMAIYLTYGYIGLKELNAENAIANAEYQVRQSLPVAGGDLEKHLRENADSYVEEVVLLSLDAPGKAREWTMILAAQRIDDATLEIETELYTKLAGELSVINEEITADAPDVTPEEKYELLLEKVSVAFDEQVKASLAESRAIYTRDADALLTYLQHLNTDVELTEREQLHKRLIETMLAILDKAAAESESTTE